jgi:hypothetical protein
MTDMNVNMDDLIDHAVANDLTRIPQLPINPDASLLLQLKTTSPEVKIAQMGLFSGSLLKFILLLLAAGVILIVWYFLSANSNNILSTDSHSKFIVSPVDSIKKKQNDSIVKEAQKQMIIHSRSSISAVQADKLNTDSLDAPKSKARHSNDLLPPDKKIKNDEGITIPIMH